jgi:hypothetical protein
MRFDPELMRTILLGVESIPPGNAASGLDVGDGDQAVMNRHIEILIEDGYIHGVVRRDNMGNPALFRLTDLTMKGHQFLANARNDTVWKKVVAKAKESGQSVGVTVLNSLLEQAAKKYAGLE